MILWNLANILEGCTVESPNHTHCTVMWNVVKTHNFTRRTFRVFSHNAIFWYNIKNNWTGMYCKYTINTMFTIHIMCLKNIQLSIAFNHPQEIRSLYIHSIYTLYTLYIQWHTLYIQDHERQYFIPIAFIVNVKKNSQKMSFLMTFSVDLSLLFKNVFTITSHFLKQHFFSKNLLIKILWL